MNIFSKISDIGNSFFDLISKWIIPLPGIVKGVISLTVLCLIAIGIITLLKKSFKVFGIILLVVVIIIFVSTIFK